jgi:uncharacterized phage protein (TIGR01671 family)
MTREIKFRAWDIGKIIYGVSPSYEINGMSETGTIRLYNPGKFPVMQFTGLKDKNGKEIYEEDILHRDFRKVPNSPNWLVVFDREKGRWVFKRGEKAFGGFGLTTTSAKEYKVIGNIYENPELINS